MDLFKILTYKRFVKDAKDGGKLEQEEQRGIRTRKITKHEKLFLIFHSSFSSILLISSSFPSLPFLVPFTVYFHPLSSFVASFFLSPLLLLLFSSFSHLSFLPLSFFLLSSTSCRPLPHVYSSCLHNLGRLSGFLPPTPFCYL